MFTYIHIHVCLIPLEHALPALIPTRKEQSLKGHATPLKATLRQQLFSFDDTSFFSPSTFKSLLGLGTT